MNYYWSLISNQQFKNESDIKIKINFFQKSQFSPF